MRIYLHIKKGIGANDGADKRTHELGYNETVAGVFK